jgi:hypothetical protein
MKISFCQTCKNRLYQLKETIFSNLDTIINDRNSELILVNYDDNELEEFVRANLKKYIEEKYLVYLRKYDAPYFEFSKAKNLAHLAAAGEFVFNLDCDNFLGNEINAYRSNWEKYPNSIIHGLSTSDTRETDGSYGRIGMLKATFNYLGGYDEEMVGVYEDGDLIQRCLRLAMPYAHIVGTNRPAIRNTRLDTIKNTANKDMTFEDYFRKNKSLSLAKLNKNGITRNQNRLGVEMIKNFQEKIKI